MASIRPAFSQLRARYPTQAPQWQHLRQVLQSLHISPKAKHTRSLSTTLSRSEGPTSRNDFASRAMDAERRAAVEALISEKSGNDMAPEGAAPSTPWTGRGVLAGRRFGEQKSMEATSGQHGRRMEPPGGQRGSGGPRRPRVQEEEEEFEDEAGMEETDGPQIHARAMPVSPSYFSRQPYFNDSYLKLQQLNRKYAHLPTAPTDQLERVAFRTLKDFRLSVGEAVKASEYARCMKIVRRLHKIHPKLQPGSVSEAIAPFKRDINPHNQKTKEIHLDKFGRALGVGKRKTSTARAWVVEGTGEVLVNGKSLSEAFGRIHDRESAVWALKSTARTDKYNVWALVDGGGTTGQAEALAMAVGKALMAHEPGLKPALRRGQWSFLHLLQYFHSANHLSSRCCHSRPQGCGEEEAWPPQGKKEACLGQALVDCIMFCVLAIPRFTKA